MAAKKPLKRAQAPKVPGSHTAGPKDLTAKPRTAAATAARKAQHKWSYAVDDLVERLSWLGADNEFMWKTLKISETTFYRWCAQHPTMREARDRGRENATAQVTKALFKRAVGYRQPAVKIFHNKDTGTVIVPYVERFPPDVAAATTWLTNRDPARWKNKQEVVVDLNVLARRALLEMADD